MVFDSNVYDVFLIVQKMLRIIMNAFSLIRNT